MIYGNLKAVISEKSDYEAFVTALQFLQRDDLENLPLENVYLEHGVYAQVSEYETGLEANLKFETHEAYYDIHYLVSGEEEIGVCSRDDVKSITEYDSTNDIQFYNKPSSYSKVYLKAGDFCVTAYNDAHMPHIAPKDKPMRVRKIVMKVPVK